MKRLFIITLSIILGLSIISCSGGKNNSPSPSNVIIYGNVITEDDNNQPEAILVQNGIIAHVGSKDEVKNRASANAKVLDYGNNYIYPGFLESHSHGFLGGYRAIGQGDISKIYPPNHDKYREIILDFINKNPNKEIYLISGWMENGDNNTKAWLDSVYPDKPVILNTVGGHSCLLNTKALKWAGIDKVYAQKMGPGLVYVDTNGEPTGYICEQPAVEVLKKVPVSFEEARSYILEFQNIMFSKGYTAVADAGVELFYQDISRIYNELEKEGKLKLRTYAYSMVEDNVSDPVGAVNRISSEQKLYNGEYFKIIGVKAFLDGVREAHTAWLSRDYDDTPPGNHGLERFSNKDKMVELILAANDKDLSVHVHSDGSGAVKFMLDSIEAAENIKGRLNQRNILAHLAYVDKEDYSRMAQTRSIPAVAPLWVASRDTEFNAEVQAVGQDRAENNFPIKSFFDNGANVVFHTDYPISPTTDIPRAFYMAELRALPEYKVKETQRNIKEAINRKQSLLALTKNVAYAWKEEGRMGSIEVGKLANFAIFNANFLKDSADIIKTASIIATIVDGEEVYKK